MGKLPGYYAHPEVPEGKVFWDGRHWQMDRFLPVHKPRLDRRKALWIGAGAALAALSLGPLSGVVLGDDTDGANTPITHLGTQPGQDTDEPVLLVPNFVGASIEQVKAWKQRNRLFASVTISTPDDCRPTEFEAIKAGNVLSQSPPAGSSHRVRKGFRVPIKVAVTC